MRIGSRINQLRKLAGMTQEQMAEKLNVSRQTISKWEAGATLPDLESVVRISRIFRVSLDELLTGEEEEMGDTERRNERITLEDLTKMNLHNRKMTLLLTGGLIFLMVSVLTAVFVMSLRFTTDSIEYMLYRYIAVGQYAYVPVNYTLLLMPSLGAGITGTILCICYVWENRKGERKEMSHTKKSNGKIMMITGALVCAAALSLAVLSLASGKKKEDVSELYGPAIADLADDEAFAIIETNAEHPVLLASSMVYDDGLGHQASISCDVYYVTDRGVEKIGTLNSMGTAYPIAYDKKGIYTGGGHAVQRYEIDDETGKLKPAEGALVTYDEEGNETYTKFVGETEEPGTEEGFLSLVEEYGEATVVGFYYGASDMP